MELRKLQTFQTVTRLPSFNHSVKYVQDGLVDLSKVQPIIFLMNNETYWKFGEQFAHAWRIGKELKRF